MKRLPLVLAASAIALGAGLAGCSDDGTAASESTVAAIEVTTTTAPAPTTTVAAATPTTEPMDPDAACIDCHTNQETLIALAVEPADTESLSTGEG